MRTTFRLLLCGLVVVGALRAAGPDKPEAGKVLVLDNDRTLEGDVERVGDRYRIRRSVGVTWVPAERVAGLCASKEEALAFLRRRSNLDDPDERLRLARWCHLQGLRDQALVEVKAAVELRPDHAESKRLLQYLEQSARYAEEAARTPPEPARARPLAEALAVDLNAEAVGLFATRVQPILINACARCHLAEGAGAFQLQRTSSDGVVDRKAMQQNLAAVVAQLNLRQPEVSPLLVKAISAHGPIGEAPLRGRQAEAFRTLENWVRLTVANNPRLAEQSSPGPDAQTPAAEKLSAPTSMPTSAPRATALATKPPPVRAEVPRVSSPTPPSPATALPAAASPTPTPPPPTPTEAESEFDPDLFNRQMHPHGKPPALPVKP
ncbi:MAG: hypothetical protein HYS12_18945 [Planctomycetes bacterium]|nr:hypothetical protein [Planctomycetota bacterium]